MADFVRKTMMGYSPVRGGYSDPECTHVILTKEEYDQILREKVQAEQSARDVKYKADNCAIGMGINMLALAITKFLLNVVFNT